MTDERGNYPTISVAAGKGGTGKTLIATSLAISLTQTGAGPVRVLDCDVEEPNVDILLPTEMTSREQVDILVPEVEMDKCIHCGKCAAVCEVSAIAAIRAAVITFHDLCSGCGACAIVCPTGAIVETPMRVGEVSTGKADGDIEVYLGRLDVGHQRSGPVTKAVKEHLAADRINIIDAPPGTACPMQEAVDGSDYCILVTEPTPFGLANLREAVETTRKLDTPRGVIINRDREGWDEMDRYLADEGIEILLRVPERREIAEAYSRGETLVVADERWRDELVAMYEHITELVAKQSVS